MNETTNKQPKVKSGGRGKIEPRWKPGESGNPNGRPKGKRNFKTDFELAAREIAKALRMGEDPEPIYIELMKQGIKSGLKGNYNFWKDLAERLYGKEPEELKITQPIYGGQSIQRHNSDAKDISADQEN